MKIKGLIGVPGVGKSTAMRLHLLPQDGWQVSSWKYPQEDPSKKPQPLSATLFNYSKTLVFGTYNAGAAFPGTDTLSKSCGSSVRQFLKDVKDLGRVVVPDILEVSNEWTFLWEGERFTNRPMFDFFRRMKQEGVEVEIKLLVASEETLAYHRSGRVQDEKWLKGMTTRVENIVKLYPDLILQ